MAFTTYTIEEIMINRLFSLSYFQPHYHSELIMSAMQLLNDEEREELRQKIFDVEKMVFDTEMIREEDAEGNIIWIERIKGDLSFYDIEMCTENSPDFHSFFQKEDGTIVTKFDIEREMNKIKGWIYDKVRERASKRRFKRMF